MPRLPAKKSKSKNLLNSGLLHLSLSIAVVSLLLISAYNLEVYLLKDKILGARMEKEKRQEELSELKFWEEVVSENPTYRDGWIEIARISWELGNKDYAIGAFNTARAIDPNSEKIKVLKRDLGPWGP